MTIKNRIATLPPIIEWDSFPLLLSEKEAASALGVSISFLRKSRCEGALKGRTPVPPFVCVRGRRYYRSVDLNRWVDNLPTQQVI